MDAKELVGQGNIGPLQALLWDCHQQGRRAREEPNPAEQVLPQKDPSLPLQAFFNTSVVSNSKQRPSYKYRAERNCGQKWSIETDEIKMLLRKRKD